MEELIRQHTEMIGLMREILSGVRVLIFVWIAFMGGMFGIAAWSVSRVNKRQQELEEAYRLLLSTLLKRWSQSEQSPHTG